MVVIRAEGKSFTSGLDLQDFFDATVRGTGELPLQTLLKAHGVELQLRRSAGG